MDVFFCEDEAVEFGVDSAIVINIPRSQIERNRARGRNSHEGRWWVRNSLAAWGRLCSHMSKGQLRRIFDKLASGGVILKGNFNTDEFNRTLWCAFANEERPLSRLENGTTK